LAGQRSDVGTVLLQLGPKRLATRPAQDQSDRVGGEILQLEVGAASAIRVRPDARCSAYAVAAPG